MGCHLFCCSALSEQGSQIHSGNVRFCFHGADIVTALLGEEWDLALSMNKSSMGSTGSLDVSLLSCTLSELQRA